MIIFFSGMVSCVPTPFSIPYVIFILGLGLGIYADSDASQSESESDDERENNKDSGSEDISDSELKVWPST